MTRLRLLLRGLFVENIGTKVVSLLVALLLFYFVREGRQEVRAFNLPVELVVPRGVVQTNEVARQVEVTVVGPKANVDGLGDSDLGTLHVDLTPFGIGASTYFFHKELFPELPKGVSVTSITPSYIAVRLEKEVSRVLPVTPILKGQPALGYRVDRYTLSDTEATLIGPTSLVERTDYLETAAIDISKATKTVLREVPIRLPAPSTRLSLTEPILVTVHIVEEIVERTLEGVPVLVPGDGHLQVEPAAVAIRVRGPLRLVDKLDPKVLQARIELDPAALRGELTLPVQQVDGLPAEVARIGAAPEVLVRSERPPGKAPAPKRREAPAETPKGSP